MVFKQKHLVKFLLASILMVGCQSNTSTKNIRSDSSIDVVVSILPQEYFVKKIAGDRLKVNVMVSPGVEPETYEPKAQQLKAASEADAYIAIGVPFETVWLDKIKSVTPQLSIIDSGKGIQRQKMVDYDHHKNENNHDKKEEENVDPHVWLSPELVKIQAKNITEGVQKIDPKNKVYYQSNLEVFLREIQQLDQQIKENLANLKTRKFIVFHPAWGYFAKNYQLEQISIESGGKEPSATELGKIIATAKQENIKVIFAEPEFNSKSAETIAKEIQGEVVFISPSSGDWANNLLKISQTFKQVLNKDEN